MDHVVVIHVLLLIVLQQFTSKFTQAFNCSDESVQLVNGLSSAQGRIEVCFNGQWGTVCDDIFGLPDALVVCRQLGYTDVIMVLGGAAYGEGTGPIWLDDVQCTGNETTIFDCTNTFSAGIDDNCNHDKDVGVICFQDIAQCNDSSVRLVDGFDKTEGRVEVCYSGIWGTVCDDNFGYADGFVVCRQLGFSGIASVKQFGRGTGPIWLDEVRCSGNERALFNCTSALNDHDCHHDKDVGVICSSSAECSDNSVRLVSGFDKTGGRVEVCYSGEWGTICDNDFGYLDGLVVCRQLGFSDIANIKPFGTLLGAGLIWLNDVSCSGYERSLFDCNGTLGPFFNDFSHNCGHYEDVGVVCSNSTVHACSIEKSVRLVNGMSKTEGRVEVCYNGQWGTVCDDKFGYNEGRVVCRQLGFTGVQDVETALTEYGIGTGFIWLDEVKCNGDEMTLFDCASTLSTHMNHDCSHFEDAGVRCFNRAVSRMVSAASVSQTVSSGYTTLHFSNSFVVAVVSGLTVLSVMLVLIAIAIFSIIIVVKRSIKKNRYDTTHIHRKDHDIQLSFEAMNNQENITPTSQRKPLLTENLKSSLIVPSNLVKEDKIDEGEFGVVYKGMLTRILENQSSTKILVAIKTLNGNHPDDDLMKEAEKMKNFDHLHVLPLIGICLGHQQLKSPCLVMPFMNNGSLYSYFNKEYSKFSVPNFADETSLLAQKKITKTLLNICLQVAKGMEYLSEQRFVHRDLAARNCMISGDWIIKVADFGLTEDIYTDEYFRMSEYSSIKLPTKWLAPESIHHRKFDEKTDVWSFGVLCWEVFSIGRVPYSGINHKKLVEMLDAGKRLKKPACSTCTQEIYNALMMSCWNKFPNSRPCFSNLVVTIEKKFLAQMAEYECINLVDDHETNM